MTIDNDISSFGALLKTFRVRRHLTQQQLANAVGVHRNAIGRWEQGDFLPASKAVVLELARYLHLDNQESSQLLETSLCAFAPARLVPLPRNPFFTGREKNLEALHARLGADQGGGPTQMYALHGLGGVGKTQLALEYVYQYAMEYRAVFWIRAESVEQIISDLLRIAEVLQLPERADKNQQRVVMAVHHWLLMHSQWLMIWDNVEDLDVLTRFLPAARQGAVLITTRRQTLGTLARDIDLLPMEYEEGMLFLLRRAKVLGPEMTAEQLHHFALSMPTEYTAALEMANTLGGLPLALDQAGAYIEETGCGLTGYRQRYGQQRVRLLDRRGTSGENHPLSVAATFRLSSERIEQEQSAAADILRVCALLYAETIPEELFIVGAPLLGTELASLATDLAHFDQAIAILRNLSLLQRQSETRTLSIHRLLQAVLREQMSEQEHLMWLARVLAALDTVFPEVTQETWEQCERLLPHVLACAAAISEQAEDLMLTKVLQKGADYLRARAQYESAEILYQRSLRIRERILGAEHMLIAIALNHLANVYYDQGKYEQAEPLYLRALVIREQLLEPGHYDLTISFNSLARLYWTQGKYEQAEPLYLRALVIREQVLGSEHPDVAVLINNLAILCTERGKYEQAGPLFERAQRIWERALGPEDLLVATSFTNQAILANYQRKYERSEVLYQRALRIQEKAMGMTHPELAHSLSGLADIYTEQKKYDLAELLYQRALRIREQAFGQIHPLSAQPLHGLANLYVQQEKYEQAEPLLQRALQLQEESLGKQHPETAKTLHTLAILRQEQDKPAEARSFAERALTILSQALGDEHPTTVTTRMLYTQLVQAATRLESVEANVAETLADQELALRQSSFSTVDPLQVFLCDCCELHPRAWCRASDLWQAYEQWSNEQLERFPLSRRAFTAQIKAHACQADRTSSARIWRGITLLQKNV